MVIVKKIDLLPDVQSGGEAPAPSVAT
jgi:hypothetical protein